MKFPRDRGLLFVLVAPVLAVSCARERTSLGIGVEDGDAGSPTFNAVDASVEIQGAAGEMCPSLECPPDRATCPTRPFPCSVDFLTDDENCGACGNACPKLAGIRAEMTCVDGKCQLTCEDAYADCNHLVEDGCEVSIESDELHCGGCGMECPAPGVCEDYICHCTSPDGCAPGGQPCPPGSPDRQPLPPEWNAHYCGDDPMCEKGYADCNGDLGRADGNGCESYLDDANTCGACDVKCGPGELCSSESCICNCGSICFTKFETDVANCGACGIQCYGNLSEHYDGVCDNGVCRYPCFAGYADCDGELTNGCEVDIMRDPQNCGGCGIRCDGVDGQACIEGKCNVKECVVQ